MPDVLFLETVVNDTVDETPYLAVSIGDLRAITIDSPEDHQAAEELWNSGALQYAGPGGTGVGAEPWSGV